MKIKKAIIFLIAACLIICAFSSCTDESASEQQITTSEAESTAGPDSPQTDKNQIVAGTGIITGQFNSAYAVEEGDILISSLIMPSILSYDRSGRTLLDASSGKNVTYGGRLFTYNALADINISYISEPAPETSTSETEPSQNIPENSITKTVYEITLGDIKFQDGTAVTADDLIFTYYVLCDSSYNGVYKLKESDIDGLTAYQHNNTMAPEVTVTSDDVSNALAEPTEELKSVINSEIIKPILMEGREFCELNWQKYVDRGYGNSAEELFVMLFTQALQSDYLADGKTFDEIFDETLALFGMNYKSLARIWFGNAEDLNDEINDLIKNLIYQQRLTDLGGQEVRSVSGIQKAGDKSVKIIVNGKGTDQTLQMISDIPVLSLHYYGNGNDYNYESDNFGVTRGDVSAIKSHSSEPFGYGPYMFDNMENLTVTLKPNVEYTLGQVPAKELKLLNIPEADRIGNIAAGNIDVALVDFNTEEIDLIKEANNGEINGNTLSTVLTSDDSYDYFGFNAASLNLGDDKGLSLRTALCKVFSKVRIDAIRTEYGDNYDAAIIQYPGSSYYWGTPKSDDESYRIAFASDNSGDDFKNEIRELFKAAGYEFDDEGLVKAETEITVTKDVKTKKGKKTVTKTVTSKETKKWQTTFSIAIPSYLIDDHIMMAAFEQAQNILDSIGFTVEPKYFEQTDEFILALQSGKYDIWAAQRDTASFNLEKYYKSDAKYNYYGIKDEEIDSLIAKALSSDAETEEKNTKSVYNSIMDKAIELPVYQKQHAFVYSSERIEIEDRAFTEYFGVFNDVGSISLK